MLTPADDFPLHQTPEVMAFSGTDRNFYDRFFFNGYTQDGSLFFAAALGIYPQLDTMDGAFCVNTNEKQYNARFSKRMKGDRLNFNLGELSFDIVKPLEQIRVLLKPNDGALKADLLFTARHFPIEEPRFIRRLGTRAFMDYTRMTQNGSWAGEIAIEGATHKVENASCFGTRDRSWGVRPVGAPESQPPIENIGQFFWLWTPANFPGHVAFTHSNDDEHGLPWNRRAVIQPLGEAQKEFDALTYDIRWKPNSRRVSELVCHLGAAQEARLTYTCGRPFYMHGLGYTHPVWGHGMDHGETASAHDIMDMASLQDNDFSLVHIQALSKTTLEYEGKHSEGVSVVEQLFLGPHATSGLGAGLEPAK